MTTATVPFNQPTLFKEGRFGSDPAPPQRSDRRFRPEPAPPQRPDRPVRAEPAPPQRPDRDARDPRDRLTLDDVLSAAWDGLAAHQSVTCPVCSGSMAPRYGSGAQPVGGRCKRCGSTLG